MEIFIHWILWKCKVCGATCKRPFNLAVRHCPNCGEWGTCDEVNNDYEEIEEEEKE